MSKYIGWEVEFHDETNDKIYTTEIIKVGIGEDIASSIVMCSLTFLVDSSFNKYFLKQHEGTLTIKNKLDMTNIVDEIFKIKLQSISNNGNVISRNPENNQMNNVNIPVKYMCKEGVKLLNSRVGGVYHNKKLDAIINDLYSQTNCELPLKLEKPNNQEIFDIEINESSFIEAIRYLNQQKGLYDNLFLMFGNTFSNESFEWIISNVNKINREEVTLKHIQADHTISEKETKSINERVYYTYFPININNNFTSNMKKVPQLIKYVSFDDDKFMKREDIPFARKLKEMNFIKANDQYDKLMELPTKLITGPNFNMLKYTTKDIIQKVGLSTLSVPRITIPNPFKLAHFKIGTPINYITNNEVFMEMDVKLIVVGWLLKLVQTNSTWSSTLNVRTATTSYKDVNS